MITTEGAFRHFTLPPSEGSHWESRDGYLADAEPGIDTLGPNDTRKVILLPVIEEAASGKRTSKAYVCDYDPQVDFPELRPAAHVPPFQSFLV